MWSTDGTRHTTRPGVVLARGSSNGCTDKGGTGEISEFLAIKLYYIMLVLSSVAKFITRTICTSKCSANFQWF